MSRLIGFSQRPPDKRSAFLEAVKTEQGLYWRYRAPPAPKVEKR